MLNGQWKLSRYIANFESKNVILKFVFYESTRIVTYYIGYSSRGLWGLVWSDFINMNLVCNTESLLYHFM